MYLVRTESCWFNFTIAMAKQLSTTTKLKLEDFFPQELSELQRNYYKNLVKSSGLLHAVQKIIFEEWAPNVQQSVLQNCLEGKGDADKFTSLLYYNLNVEDHLNYTRNHIENVKTAYHCFNNVMSKHIKESVGVKREEEYATEDQINRHDESKFSLFECVTYAAKFFKKEKELLNFPTMTFSKTESERSARWPPKCF